MVAKDAPRIKWLVEPTFDDDGVQRTAGLDQDGREHGDPTPMRPPVGIQTNQSDDLHVILRNLFHKERARFMAAVEAEEFESEEEANDFLCPEELFPPGNEPWEDIHDFPVPAAAGNGEGGGPSPQPPPAAAPAPLSGAAAGRSVGVVVNDEGDRSHVAEAGQATEHPDQPVVRADLLRGKQPGKVE